MEKKIINEKQRGLLFKNGRLVKLLGPGKYYSCKERHIEVLSMDKPLESRFCTLETMLKLREIKAATTVVEVGDQERALHYVDGKFSEILPRGRYAFWSATAVHEFQLVDISTPEVAEDVPSYIFGKIPSVFYTKVEVAEYQKARLFFDQKFVRILSAGSYYFWKTGVKVGVDYVDIRLTQMNIAGQELLTQDKVSIRVSFVCNYKVTDYVKILTEIDDFEAQLHVAAQLALREYVGKYKLDEILENKDQMSGFVLERLKAREQELFVEITDAGVKDIILPGAVSYTHLTLPTT